MRMRRYGRFVIMRSSGPEICGLEIGRKSRGGVVGFLNLGLGISSG